MSNFSQINPAKRQYPKFHRVLILLLSKLPSIFSRQEQRKWEEAGIAPTPLTSPLRRNSKTPDLLDNHRSEYDNIFARA